MPQQSHPPPPVLISGTADHAPTPGTGQAGKRDLFFLYQQHSILSGNALLITSIEPLMMRQYTTPTFGNTSRQLRTEIRSIDHIQISLAILSPHEFQIRFCSTLEPFDSNVTSLLIIDSRGTNEGFNIIAIDHSPALSARAFDSKRCDVGGTAQNGKPSSKPRHPSIATGMCFSPHTTRQHRSEGSQKHTMCCTRGTRH